MKYQYVKFALPDDAGDLSDHIIDVFAETTGEELGDKYWSHSNSINMDDIENIIQSLMDKNYPKHTKIMNAVDELIRLSKENKDEGS